jgi:hypothetical protein
LFAVSSPASHIFDLTAQNSFRVFVKAIFRRMNEHFATSNVPLDEPFWLEKLISDWVVSQHWNWSWVGRLPEGSVWFSYASKMKPKLKVLDESGAIVVCRRLTLEGGSCLQLSGARFCGRNLTDASGNRYFVIDARLWDGWKLLKVDLATGITRVGDGTSSTIFCFSLGMRFCCWRSDHDGRTWRQRFDPETARFLGDEIAVDSPGAIHRIESDGTVWFVGPGNHPFRWNGDQITREAALPNCLYSQLLPTVDLAEDTQVSEVHWVLLDAKTREARACIVYGKCEQDSYCRYAEFNLRSAYQTQGLRNRCAFALAASGCSRELFPDDESFLVGQKIASWCDRKNRADVLTDCPLRHE